MDRVNREPLSRAAAPRRDAAPRRAAALASLLLAAALLSGGCTWWDKNVVERVKSVTTGRLTVTSDPPGADVFVDDVFQGKTPLTLTYKFGVKDMINGFVVVVQKRGYLPVRREVSAGTENLTFRLTRMRRRRK